MKEIPGLPPAQDFMTVRDGIYRQVSHADEAMQVFSQALPKPIFANINDISLWRKAFPDIEFMHIDEGMSGEVIDWFSRTPEERAFYVQYMRDPQAVAVEFDCRLERLSDKDFIGIQSDAFKALEKDLQERRKYLPHVSDEEISGKGEEQKEWLKVGVEDQSITLGRKTVKDSEMIWWMWLGGCFRSGMDTTNLTGEAKANYLTFAARFEFYEKAVDDRYMNGEIRGDNIVVSNVEILFESPEGS